MCVYFFGFAHIIIVYSVLLRIKVETSIEKSQHGKKPPPESVTSLTLFLFVFSTAFVFAITSFFVDWTQLIEHFRQKFYDFEIHASKCYDEMFNVEGEMRMSISSCTIESAHVRERAFNWTFPTFSHQIFHIYEMQWL